MSRYKFVKYPVEREGFNSFGDPTKVIVATDTVSMNDLIESFENFLKASGFTFPPGAHLGYEYDDEEVSEKTLEAVRERTIEVMRHNLPPTHMHECTDASCRGHESYHKHSHRCDSPDCVTGGSYSPLIPEKKVVSE